MINIRADFGAQLRKLRKEMGYSQEDLADKAKLHPTYIGQIERGLRNPSLVNLEKIAKALKTTASKLLPF